MGDLLGNTILTHYPNKAAKSHYSYTSNKGVKSLPCILWERENRRENKNRKKKGINLVKQGLVFQLQNSYGTTIAESKNKPYF